MKEIVPLNDRVLIEPIVEDNFSKGGVLLTRSNDDAEVMHAIVLAVGKGKSMPSGRMPIDVEVGDKVIYGALNNTVEDTLNGKDVLLVVEQAIVAIIKE
jgi:chaperonin GroES